MEREARDGGVDAMLTFLSHIEANDDDGRASPLAVIRWPIIQQPCDFASP